MKYRERISLTELDNRIADLARQLEAFPPHVLAQMIAFDRMHRAWVNGTPPKFVVHACLFEARQRAGTHDHAGPIERTDECDCENPEPAAGVALVSNHCPVHNDRPLPRD